MKDKKYEWKKRKEHNMEFEGMEDKVLVLFHLSKELKFVDVWSYDNRNVQSRFTEQELIDLIGKEDFSKLVAVEPK